MYWLVMIIVTLVIIVNMSPDSCNCNSDWSSIVDGEWFHWLPLFIPRTWKETYKFGTFCWCSLIWDFPMFWICKRWWCEQWKVENQQKEPKKNSMNPILMYSLIFLEDMAMSKFCANGGLNFRRKAVHWAASNLKAALPPASLEPRSLSHKWIACHRTLGSSSSPQKWQIWSKGWEFPPSDHLKFGAEKHELSR